MGVYCVLRYRGQQTPAAQIPPLVVGRAVSSPTRYCAVSIRWPAGSPSCGRFQTIQQRVDSSSHSGEIHDAVTIRRMDRPAF